jgi:hypothetical protein
MQEGLLFQVDYPEITEGVVPRYRFMSAYEQHVEPPHRVRWHARVRDMKLHCFPLNAE